MKNKLKILFLFCFAVMLLFSSCEKEIYENAENQSQLSKKLSIQKIKYSQLKSNKKIVEKLKKVASKKLSFSIAQRAVYDEDLEVLIDTTNIVKMQSDSEESFTFNIVDYTDSSNKENLILVSKTDGSFDAYIAEYNLTQQDLDILTSGGTLLDIKPTSISEIDADSKVAVSGPCVTSYTYSFSACYNSSGNIISNNGELGNDCVGMGFDYEMQVITINLSCLADSGGGGGNTGTSGSGTNGSTSSGDSGYSDGSTSSTGSGGSTGSNSNTINTTYVPCTECLDFSPELGDFIYNLNTNQLDFWNNLNIRIQQQIVEFLNQNNYSVEAIEIIIFALTDLMNDECAILPTFLDPTQVSAPYDPDLFGDYPVSTTQQDHDAIQQQFNNLRNTVGNLAAVNYLITTYNMNAFGSNSINFNYTISFENGLSNGADANAIRTFTNGILTSCNLEIDINLFSSVDFGYITRVIKHELLHILQGITYGQYGVSLAAQEFDAYYLQIFGFKELKAISNASIQYQLAKKMITYMKQLTTSEKLESKKQIDKVKLTFPELCKD